MAISLEEVRRIAGLAQLELDEASERMMTDQLGQILSYMEKLGELDTTNVPPARGGAIEPAGPRGDSPRPSLPAEKSLSNAPESGQGHFKVPRVLPG